jgi:hydroxyacylglutathione hydrolase
MRLIPLPALTDNYIWLLVDAGGAALIVDPGDAAPVLRALQREQLTPTAILLTHHHPDHIGGVDGLCERYPGLEVIAPHDVRIATASRRVGDGEQVYFAAPQASFRVIAIPGHTLSHIAYFGAGVVLAGDTLFSVGCGRMFEGTPAQMLASLDRLSALPDNTQRIHCDQLRVRPDGRLRERCAATARRAGTCDTRSRRSDGAR